MVRTKHIFLNVMAVFIAITFFACEGNYKNVQNLNRKDGAPIAEGISVNTKYTDSGKVIFNLITPRFLGYSNLEFPYSEFPDGIEVHSWDENGKESIVTAEYAIQYDNTDLIDLRENVVLTTQDVVVTAEQLYWDQKNNWVFTDRPYKMKLKDGSFNEGQGFDSSEDFKTFLSLRNQGVQIIEPKKEKTTDEQ